MGDGKATTAALVASLGAFLFGLDIGYIAPILECGSFKRDVGHLSDWSNPDSKISAVQAGFIVSIFSVGCLATSFPPISSFFLDQFGRRSSIILGGVIFLLGCLLQSSSKSMGIFLFGRLVTGTSIGLLSNVVPMYQAEMAPPALRGTLTSMYNMMITAGIFIAALLDEFLVEKENGWRMAIALQAIPAFVILLTMPFLPRSPRWLVQQDRLTEARAALTLLRGAQAAEQELQEIVEEFKAECAVASGSWSEVFRGRMLLLVGIGASLQMLQQLVGMNAFMYFGPRIFKHLNLDANLFQTISNATNMLFTLPCLYFIEKTGRRSLFITGAAGMAISNFALGFLGMYGTTGSGENIQPASPLVGVLLAAMVLCFIASFASTWGPTVWVYCAEMFPLRHRARCVGVTTMTNWVGNFLIAQFSPILMSSIEFETFLLFGGFCILALILGIWLPETKGVPLEQIGACFDERFGLLQGKSDAADYGAVTKRP
ncbi:ecdD [Symbiodinium natans]|uniref:Hexose transporter 1 n=1 Tax=Symbiodinium natans TaxID=878477 RepID=A0A812Q179_9DINO|nr:ecdD [Symbiodinium natans]